MPSNAKAADDGLVTDGFTKVNTSLGSKVPTTRKINGKALSGDVTLAPGDLGQDNAQSGQTLTWNGTKWVPTTLSTASNVTVASTDYSDLVTN